jgi:hypothetical protein
MANCRLIEIGFVSTIASEYHWRGVSDPSSPILKLYKPLFDFTEGFKSDRGCGEHKFQNAEGSEGCCGPAAATRQKP